MRWWIVLAFLAGCTKDTGGTPHPSDPVVSSTPEPDDCSTLGLPRLGWDDGPYGETRLATAGDFTLPTTDGDWTFSTNFTGCDSYLFIPSVPTQEQGWPTALWSRDGDTLFDVLPKNTEVFFISNADSGDDADADLAMIQATIKDAYGPLNKDDTTWWKAHVHYVTKRVKNLDDTWVGRYLASPGYGFGIDRAQHIRDLGSFADPTRYNATKQWFEPNMGYAAFEAVRYNYDALRDAQVAADGATWVSRPFDATLVEDGGWTGATAEGFLDLPSPDEIRNFDTLELDFTMGCTGPNEATDCPAWDRIVNGALCDASDPTTCPVEFGRWISAYWREGHWLTDASYLLPFLADGGQRRLTMYSVDPYLVTVDWRFSNQGRGRRPAQTDTLWQTFPGMDDNYLTNFPDRTVHIPADATKVELTVVISGHGGTPGDNCAEFCDTHHFFSINGGAPHEISFPQTASTTGCEDEVVNGTVPMQYGTWFYGRSNWCPGKAVTPIVVDVTSEVVPGEDALVTYDATGPNGPLPGGGASMDVNALLTSWVAE
jgi:hypothetical protein